MSKWTAHCRMKANNGPVTIHGVTVSDGSPLPLVTVRELFELERPWLIVDRIEREVEDTATLAPGESWPQTFELPLVWKDTSLYIGGWWLGYYYQEIPLRGDPWWVWNEHSYMTEQLCRDAMYDYHREILLAPIK